MKRRSAQRSERLWTPGVLPDTEIDSLSLEDLLSRSELRPSPELTLEYLQSLARQVNALGGWTEVAGKDAWNDVTGRNARRDYNAIWFPILKEHEFRAKYKTSNPLRLSASALKPDSLVPIPVIEPPLDGRLTREFWRSVFSHEVALLRGFIPLVWPFDHSLFSAECLEQQHGDAPLTVLLEDANPHTDSSPEPHASDSLETTLRDYLSAVYSQVPQGPVLQFASDIEICHWPRQIAELRRRLPSCLLFDSQEDSLRLMRMHASGVTLPLLDIRPCNAWKGASSGEAALTGVELNHGPGTVAQWALGRDCALLFESDLQQKTKVRLKQSDGMCWPDENFLLSQGYKTYFGLQQTGDILFLAPGTMHWSRTVSRSICSTWRLAPQSVAQFSALFASDGLYVHTLALDLLNHEMMELPEELIRLLSEKLQLRFGEESALMAVSRLSDLGVFPGHKVTHCEKCSRELFYCYASCPKCETPLCLRCARKHRHRLAGCCTLFRAQDFERLVDRARARCEGKEDLFDPRLNRHFRAADRDGGFKAWLSPYGGTPSCVLFKPSDFSERRQPAAAPPPLAPEPQPTEVSVLQPYVIPKRQKHQRTF